jgi:DNA-binding MarR family transcriptional regulator
MSTMNDALATLAGVTENERSFLAALVDGLYAEPGYSDVTVDEVAKRMGVTVKSAKGILGSLVKKGFVWTNRADTDAGKFDIIYLSEKHYDLHDRWFALAAEEAAEIAAATAPAHGIGGVTAFAQAIVDGDHDAALAALTLGGIPDGSIPVSLPADADLVYVEPIGYVAPPDDGAPDVPSGEYVYKMIPLDYVPPPEGVVVSACVAEVIEIADELNESTFGPAADIVTDDAPPATQAETSAAWAEHLKANVLEWGPLPHNTDDCIPQPVTGGFTLQGPQPGLRALALVKAAQYRLLTAEECDFLIARLTAAAGEPAGKPVKAPKAKPAATTTAKAPKGRDARLPPAGEVIQRIFKGVKCAVAATDDNSVIGLNPDTITGHTFASLSGAAKAITGHETNGFAFWLTAAK